MSGQFELGRRAVFYYASGWEMNALVWVLVAIELQRPYAPYWRLWESTRLLVLAQFLSWCLMVGLVQMHLEASVWAFGSSFVPLGLGLLWTLGHAWPTLRLLSWGHRLHWWGLWGAFYALGLSGSLYWWLDEYNEAFNYFAWNENQMFQVFNAWEYYGDVLTALGLGLLLLIYARAGYQVFKKRKYNTNQHDQR